MIFQEVIEEKRWRADNSNFNQEPPAQPDSFLVPATRGWTLSDEARKKISKANTGKIKSPEARAKMSLAKRGYVASDSTRLALSRALKGKKKSKIMCERLGASRRGKKLSAAHRVRMSEAAKLRPPNPCQLRKLGEREIEVVSAYRRGDRTVDIAARFGVRRDLISTILRRHGVKIRPHKLTPEQIQKMAKSKRGKPLPKTHPWTIKGRRLSKEIRERLSIAHKNRWAAIKAAKAYLRGEFTIAA